MPTFSSRILIDNGFAIIYQIDTLLDKRQRMGVEHVAA